MNRVDRLTPTTLNKFDRVSKKNVEQYNNLPEKLLKKTVDWSKTNIATIPLQAEVDGNLWLLKVNDFPEDEMYTLLIEDRANISFTEKPADWHFPK